MGFELVTFVIGICIGAAIVYFFSKASKGKRSHWSEGYVVVGRDSPLKKEAEKPQESGSMFPPGW